MNHEKKTEIENLRDTLLFKKTDNTSLFNVYLFCAFKKTAGLDINLTESELAIFDQFKSKSQYYLQIKYDKIKKIIDDTNLFDLDLRSSSLLLIDKFRS